MPQGVWSTVLPVALWPPADRAAWQAALRPGNPFQPGGIASSWSAATRRMAAAGYGRFLAWLKERGELDETAGAAARITRERLVAYLDELRRANRGYTIQSRINELGDAMRALEPQGDWHFINRAAGRLRANTVPARGKRGRLPPIAEVIAQGYRMMKEVEDADHLSELGRAAFYRDGLLLVFLAYHPLRPRNLSLLRIGRHLVMQDEQLLVKIDASETKTRQPIEQEVSPLLSAAMRRYVDWHRPVLLRARGRWYKPATDELWISRDGSPCSAESFQNIIAKHVSGPDGRPLSPHLFRSMAATSIAIEAPGSVDLIPAILTHRSYATGERYYNLAGSLEASRAFNAALDAVRKDLEAALHQGAQQEDKRQ